MKVDTDIQLTDVCLSEENIAKVKCFVEELQNTAKLRKYGLRPSNRLLFYGATGCGKTYLGKALSNHLGYKMYYVSISQALSQGNAAKNLTDIFKSAGEEGSLIFLDEVDSIAWNRADNERGEEGEKRRATNALFQLMDQLPPGVLFIAATNLLNQLDAAFCRRFDMKLKFEKPKIPLREAVERFKHPNILFVADKVDTAFDLRCTLSFDEIRKVIERVTKRAILADNNKIYLSDCYIEAANAQAIKTHLTKRI